MFAVPLLSSFVIASCANEEKLPHPQHPVLLINPSCKQPRRCPSSLSAPPPPARSASISLVHISAGVSGGASSSQPMGFFWKYYSNSGWVGVCVVGFILNWIVEGDVKEPYITWTYRQQEGRVCCSVEAETGIGAVALRGSTTTMTKAVS